MDRIQPNFVYTLSLTRSSLGFYYFDSLLCNSCSFCLILLKFSLLEFSVYPIDFLQVCYVIDMLKLCMKRSSGGVGER